MLSEEVRARLATLNRSLCPPAAKPPSPSALAPTRLDAGSVLGQAVCEPLSTGRERHTAWGPCWSIEQPLEQVWPAGPSSIEQATLSGTPLTANQARENHARDMHHLGRAFPRRLVYLDLETCGLSGSMIFLIGLLHYGHHQLQLTQLWARHYGEEKALLQSMWETIRDADVLVTFNGKSFDWPQVHDRSTLHHLGSRREVGPSASPAMTSDDERPEPFHVDLLHHARRRWQRQLPNCRLQTLERYICGRHRVGDIPGRDIPAAYHQYVRNGDQGPVPSILHHNALDLITLLQLTLVLLSQPKPEA
jgi:uncharacterized protein YprB with RNaseH-like and TPR domain